ncbi:MAG TPA: transcription-repair coupling factor [Deferrisomatales bacterium]|nr:transcription-repair coupling factor [Deferrisomatales bacterium]
MNESKVAPFPALVEALRTGAGQLCADGLRSSSRAYVAARLLRELKRPLLVLTPNLSAARRFATEVEFFLNIEPSAGSLPWDSPVVVYPGWETAPFEALPRMPEVSARRVAALFRASHGGPFVCVCPVAAALQRTVPPAVIDAASRLVAVGEELPPAQLRQQLVESGYHVVGQVEERGEASFRGGILDVFAPFYPHPLRIEFFGDAVESIRTFDPASQRSSGKLAEVVILPAREVVADASQRDRAVTRLRGRCRELGRTRAETMEAVEALRDQPLSPLREALFPYFYDGVPSLLAHFPDDTLLVFDEAGPTRERAGEVFGEIALGHARALERNQVVPAATDEFLAPEEWEALSASRQVLCLEELTVEGALPGCTRRGFDTRSNQDLSTALRQHRGGERMLTPLVEELRRLTRRGWAVWLVARGDGSAQKLRDLLAEYGVELGDAEPFPAVPSGDGHPHLARGNLTRGFRFPEKKLLVVSGAEIFGEKVRRRPTPRRGFRSSLAELSPGDAVVHADFGVGLYRGLQQLEVVGEEGDYLLLEYAGGDKLYLPVTRIALVQKYSASGEGAPRLDKLGGTAWQKIRGKAAEGVEKMAHELLELYARREMARRPAYPAADLMYREFEATFPYEETPDQAEAIRAVIDDLAGPRPMDRLICGDVGYGKTEVALRAAFRAVTDGRQVAVLVPTTVLAAQHFQSFRSRFSGYPLRVEMLSRFVSAAEQKQVLARVESGGVDVVVGTHRVLQRDVKWKNLGLVVVDEEHRFGVAHKERIKRLRAQVDMLALSATPIPRTLNFALSGVRDLSVIETPPADRLAVRTHLARFDDDVVREAIERELNRGGQVYFVHNRVQSIDDIAHRVRELVPRARVGVGHGQMRERELEQVMEQFVGGELDVLVCTAIIESGLDIPRANTILINRADRFGLADLYQLRGRVGRSNLRAYTYLLVPAETELTGDARRRLQALQEFTELGAGFKIATHDLEIRGAGEFLGKAQSGHIAAIGFDLYTELLEDAVQRLRGEPTQKAPEPEIRLRVPAHFPVEYVEDPRQRLELYERLTRVADVAEVDELRYELIDRYGPLPLFVENLLEVMKIRRRLVELWALGLDYTGKGLVVSLSEESRVDPERILTLVQSAPAAYRLTPDHRLLWQCGALEGQEILPAAADLLKRLG